MAVKKAGAGRAKRATKKTAGTRARAGSKTAKGGTAKGGTAKERDRPLGGRTRKKTGEAGNEIPTTAGTRKAAKKSIRVLSRSSAVAAEPEAKRRPARSSAVAAEPKVKKALARYRQKRDFEKTAEPSGEKAATRAKALRFVIQKHAASHLHFDWRLELDGVMKSWAVPKGPSVVPGERRLAMEVEDHPISYNTFEGTIPKGQYGGGTVMLWDRGVYEATDGGGAASLRRGYAKGKLDITLLGERLKGSFTMVRTRGEGERAQWLLMKRTDDWADADRDIVTEITTSVDSGRTMEQIAAGRRVWNSNRR